MKKLMLTSFAQCIALAALAAAKTVYVDDDNYDWAIVDDSAAYIAAGFDGSTEAKAFGTIQAAIDASTTKDGDTILVLPGTYDKGGGNLTYDTTDAGPTRVVATKGNLIIKSRDGAAKTHIVGKLADTATGCGAGAMRCFGQYWKTGVHLRGFTLRNGGTSDASSDTPASRGGAVFSVVAGASCPTYVVDCVVSNCAAKRGIIQNGTVFRSLFCDNIYTGEGIGRQAQFYSCIFTRNRGGGQGIVNAANGCAVNCTIVGNTSVNAICWASGVYNSVLGLSSSSTEIDNTVADANATQTANGAYQTIAPAFGDFRVIKGSAAETAGNPQYVDAQMFFDRQQSFFPTDELNKDFFGNPIWDCKSASVRAGAVNDSAEPVGGAMQFDGLDVSKIAIVEGVTQCRAGVYAYPTNYPVQWSVKARPVSGKFFAWTTSAVHDSVRFPDKNDDAWLMPPPQTDVVMTNTFVLANKEIWVDPIGGDDTEGEGTVGAPYRTLQKAGAGANRWYVHCVPGVYAEGGNKYWGIANRIQLSGRDVRYVSEGDRTDTTIVGGLDGNPPVDTQPGCGPNASRLLAADGSAYVCFTGFTIRDCASDSRASGAAETVGHQGGICRAVDYATFTDCLFTNCFGVSTLFNGCRVQRCEILGCHVDSASTGYTTVFSSCDFDVTNGAVYWPGADAYNCTFRGSGVMAAKNVSCIGAGGERLRSSVSEFEGCIAYDYAVYEDGSSGYINEDPLFVSPKGGRVMLRSPAFTCGVKPTAENLGANLYKYATTGLDGVPLQFIDGKPAAGAWQKGVANAATVKAPNGGLSLSDKTTCEITEDRPLVVTMGAGTRPCVGFTANGATNLFADASSTYTFTRAEATAAGSLVLQAIYTKDWYVSPDGDDAASGSFAGVAFRTLTNAMAHAASGDTVRALPGTYAEGGEAHASGYEILQRVVVKPGVTLESTDGPEETIIRGAAASEPDVLGCGADAIRCVYVKNGGVISGFTLTDGHTKGKSDGQHYHDDWSGGGVLGQSESATVRNCIIRQNSAYRGGGARFILLDTCQVVDNTAGFNAPAVGESQCVNTLFKDNWGGVNCYGCTLFDCTFRGCWNDEAKTMASEAFMSDIGASSDKTTVRWANIVVENGYVRYHAYEGVECTLCANVFATGLSNLPTGTTTIHGVTKVTADDLAFGADDRPTAGRSCIVDKSDPDYVSLKSDYLTDAAGGQRVYNGTRDVGAMEADWRPRYGKDVGARFAVDAATPGVVESDAGKVVIAAGEVLSGTWPVRAGRSVPRLMTFTVVEGGSATVTVDGVSTTYAAGVYERRFDATTANDVQIACTAGSVTVDRFRNELGGMLLVR